MMTAEERRKETDLVQQRAARKLAEIGQLLVPGDTTLLSAEELLRRAEVRLAELPPVEREKTMQRALVAYSELDQLIAEMTNCQGAVADELRRMSTHSKGIGAYAQAARTRARAH